VSGPLTAPVRPRQASPQPSGPHSIPPDLWQSPPPPWAPGQPRAQGGREAFSGSIPPRFRLNSPTGRACSHHTKKQIPMAVTSCSSRSAKAGCGVVYVAEQEEPVRRRVALKVIKLGMDTKAGHRPVRGRAPGPGPDGSSEHRQGARRRARPRSGRPLLRHGTGPGIRITDYCDQNNLPTRSGSICSFRSVTPSSTPTRRASSTGTSSRRTSW
jgi:hypothetical protein